jgi:hypothetical protein
MQRLARAAQAVIQRKAVASPFTYAAHALVEVLWQLDLASHGLLLRGLKLCSERQGTETVPLDESIVAGDGVARTAVTHDAASFAESLQHG